jgi:Ion channel
LTPVDTLELPLPDWMTSPSALINLEVLRVLRLRRVLRDMDTFVKYERALGIRKSNVQEWQLQLARVLLSLFTLVSVSTGLIYTAEHDVNPAIPDFFTAAYFSLSTISTLGLGDITPMTWQGRLVVCGSILAGVAILPAQAAALVEALVARRESIADQQSSRRFKRRKNRGDGGDLNGESRMVLETTFQCPSCGSSMHWSSARFCWSCGETLPPR